MNLGNEFGELIWGMNLGNMESRRVRLIDQTKVRDLFGIHDQYLRKIESMFKVQLAVEDGEIEVLGESANVSSVEHLLSAFQWCMEEGFELSSQDFQVIAKAYQQDATLDFREFFSWKIGNFPANFSAYSFIWHIFHSEY